jgi:hypothetical protein
MAALPVFRDFSSSDRVAGRAVRALAARQVLDRSGYLKDLREEHSEEAEGASRT